MYPLLQVHTFVAVHCPLTAQTGVHVIGATSQVGPVNPFLQVHWFTPVQSPLAPQVGVQVG